MFIYRLFKLYDRFEKMGVLTEENYEIINISHRLILNPDGTINDIKNIKENIETVQKNGKTETKSVTAKKIFPKRTYINNRRSYMVEQRGNFLLGISGDVKKKGITFEGKEGDLRFAAMVKAAEEFFEGMSDPLVDAYMNFIRTWNPADAENNDVIKTFDTAFEKSNFEICLAGKEDEPLHENAKVKARWEELYEKFLMKNAKMVLCPYTKKVEPLAVLHDKIKLGTPDSLPYGANLVSYNCESERSYGNKNGENCSMGITAMKRYTKTLNYMLSNREYRFVLGDIAFVFWSEDDSVPQALIKKAMESLFSGTELSLEDRKLLRNKKVIVAGLRSPAQAKAHVVLEFYGKDDIEKYIRLSDKIAEDFYLGDNDYNNLGSCLFEAGIKKAKDLNRVKGDFVSALLKGLPYPQEMLASIIGQAMKPSKNRYKLAGLARGILNSIKDEEHQIPRNLNTDIKSEGYIYGRAFAIMEHIQLRCYKKEKKTSPLIGETLLDAAMINPQFAFGEANRILDVCCEFAKMGFKDREFVRLLLEPYSMPTFLVIPQQCEFLIGYTQQKLKFMSAK